MPFSFAPYLDFESSFFKLSLLALILVLQIILGIILPGQSHKPPHMHWFAQRLLAALSQKLNRPNRSKGSLKIRGLLSFLFMALVAWSIARMAEVLAYSVEYGWALIVFLVWGTVNIMVPWRAMRGLIAQKTPYEILRKADALSDLTGFSFKEQDGHTVARAGVFYAGYSMLRYLVAPVLFYYFLGLMGMMFYLFLSASEKPLDVYLVTPFTRFFALFENILDFIPARLSCFVLYIAAFITPTAHPQQMLKMIFDGGQKFPGLSLSVIFKGFTGAVHTSLGGAVVYQSGQKILLPWIGPKAASAQAGVAEIKRAFLLHIYCTVLVLLLILAMLAV